MSMFYVIGLKLIGVVSPNETLSVSLTSPQVSH